MKLVCVGDVNLDYYTNMKKKFLGGISLNFAVNAKELGADVSIVSCIGDYQGRYKNIKQILSNLRINTERLHVKHGKTPEQNIKIIDDGSRKFIGYTEGVLKNFKLNKGDIKFIKSHDVVIVPFSEGTIRLFKQIMALDYNITRISDFSEDSKYGIPFKIIEKHIYNLDIIFIGGNERIIPKASFLSKKYKKLIVITLGKKGSLAILDGKKTFYPTRPIKAIDTTGCGDAFQAAFTISYLVDKKILRALKAGTKQALKVAKHFGGTKYEI